ncbi:MAG: S9 family peptidase [Chitinophagaceae bacterium]|nr:S9 family peptidase [Anaerolineae bacterium]
MAKKYRFEQFAATRLYSPIVAYSPDGEHIAHANNATGQFNLWIVPSGGGIPHQLTSYTDNTVRAVTWSPNGQQIVIQADQNGDEQHQLYTTGVLGGWPAPLTQKLDSQHNVGEFSPDGKTLTYCANDRSPSDVDLILRDMTTGELQRVKEGGLNFPASWSPDGKHLLFVDFRSNTDQDIYVYDVKAGTTTNATSHEGEIVFLPGPWAADGSGFYLLTNQGREFTGMGFYKLAEGKWEWFITPEHDIENVAVSKNREVMIWAQNENGASKLYGKNLNTGDSINVPLLPLGVVSAMDISPDGTRLALIYVRPGEASNLYEVDLKTGAMPRLGQSMLGGIDPADLVEPELITYPTHDGRDIPAWLYKPKGDGVFPVILSIHGGPEAQERPIYNYNGFYQYMLSRGFGILAPNIRGSTGYGITYQKLIHRDWGGAELKDIEHAALYLRSLDWVDSNRIAIYGGSFGGFATLSAMTRLPQYWAVGVDIVGPSNLLTFTKSVPPFWRRFMKLWVGDPEEDHDFLLERSPITYVDNIRAPMLVIQGAKDPRVVQAESDQMVERIKANGGDVRYFVDENEGHGTTRRENTIKWFSMIVDYLEEQLLDEPDLS